MSDTDHFVFKTETSATLSLAKGASAAATHTLVAVQFADVPYAVLFAVEGILSPEDLAIQLDAAGLHGTILDTAQTDVGTASSILKNPSAKLIEAIGLDPTGGESMAFGDGLAEAQLSTGEGGPFGGSAVEKHFESKAQSDGLDWWTNIREGNSEGQTSPVDDLMAGSDIGSPSTPIGDLPGSDALVDAMGKLTELLDVGPPTSEETFEAKQGASGGEAFIGPLGWGFIVLGGGAVAKVAYDNKDEISEAVVEFVEETSDLYEVGGKITDLANDAVEKLKKGFSQLPPEDHGDGGPTDGPIVMPRWTELETQDITGGAGDPQEEQLPDWLVAILPQMHDFDRGLDEVILPDPEKVWQGDIPLEEHLFANTQQAYGAGYGGGEDGTDDVPVAEVGANLGSDPTSGENPGEVMTFDLGFMPF